MTNVKRRRMMAATRMMTQMWCGHCSARRKIATMKSETAKMMMMMMMMMMMTTTMMLLLFLLLSFHGLTCVVDCPNVL